VIWVRRSEESEIKVLTADIKLDWDREICIDLLIRMRVYKEINAW
jgi:hypothetical protein